MSASPPHSAQARPRASTIALALVAVMAGITYWTISAGPRTQWVPLVGTMTAWVVFIPAALIARKVPARQVTAVVLIGAALLGGVALLAPPSTSSDSARYAWDGMVQKAGISPYRYVPADDALRPLRPAWLFRNPPPGATCQSIHFPTGTLSTTNVPGGGTLCTAINRPTVPTIYPAAAEIYFLVVRLIPDSDTGFIAFQLMGFLLCMSITVALLVFLHRTGAAAHQAVWWAWSPLVSFEAINNAHVDVLAATLLLAAALLLAGGRVLASGIAFGAAVAVKLIPVISAPALLYRRPIRFVLAAVATFAALYLPYVLASGGAVLGYLPGYLSEEGYYRQDSARFTLLKFVLPIDWAAPTAIVLLVLLALYVWRTTDVSCPWDGQVLLFGGTLLLVSPNYPWYALLLLPFVVLSGRYEFAALAPILAAIYLTAPQPYGQQVARLGLSAGLVLLVLAPVVRRRLRGKPRGSVPIPGD